MFLKKRGDRTFIDGARVGCPLRGTDVDIEQCMACGKLLRVVNDDPPYFLCTAWRETSRSVGLIF